MKTNLNQTNLSVFALLLVARSAAPRSAQESFKRVDHRGSATKTPRRRLPVTWLQDQDETDGPVAVQRFRLDDPDPLAPWHWMDAEDTFNNPTSLRDSLEGV